MLSADPDARATVETVDAQARRVERMLQWARLNSDLGLGRGPCDLLRILRLVIDDLRPRATHAFRLDDGDLEGLMVAADPDAVAVLLRDLIENARGHGTGAGRITVTTAGAVSIENPAPVAQLPDTRFARGSGSSGHGLGLSIVETLAQTMYRQVTRSVGDSTCASPLSDRAPSSVHSARNRACML